MDSKGIVEELHNLEFIAYGYNINGEVLGMDCIDFEQIMVDAADYITDLLEEVEKLKAERDSARHNLQTIQKMVQEYQEEIIPGFRERAEKAEAQRDELFGILNGVCRDVREKSADEYVCGLCEYDGAYITESGDWANECPGFDMDDCFCMKKSIRKKFGQKEE